MKKKIKEKNRSDDKKLRLKTVVNVIDNRSA